MHLSAFIVKVPEAEPWVGSLRHRFDASAKLGVPAHITLLFPFMVPENITEEVKRTAQRALTRTPGFSFTLRSVGRFPSVVYLAPEPGGPFLAMTRSLVEAFPEYLPYGGIHEGTVPHLTVGQGTAADTCNVVEGLTLALQRLGAVNARCNSVSLIENSSGAWRELHSFPLS